LLEVFREIRMASSCMGNVTDEGRRQYRAVCHCLFLPTFISFLTTNYEYSEWGIQYREVSDTIVVELSGHVIKK
jgi:hypothetical protein